MAGNIRSIPTGTDTSDATATADKIVRGYTAYVNGVKITGTKPPSSEILSLVRIMPTYSQKDGYISGSYYTLKSVASSGGFSSVSILINSILARTCNGNRWTELDLTYYADSYPYKPGSTVAVNLNSRVCIFSASHLHYYFYFDGTNCHFQSYSATYIQSYDGSNCDIDCTVTFNP